MAEGDICRYDDATGTFVPASLVDWQAFFLYRDLAHWRDSDAHQDRMDARHRHRDVPYWMPLDTTWDALETRLLTRWGGVGQRWWDRGPHLLPRYACLVCHDTGRVRGDRCPGCRPKTPPRKKARKRDWVAMDTPQLFG